MELKRLGWLAGLALLLSLCLFYSSLSEETTKYHGLSLKIEKIDVFEGSLSEKEALLIEKEKELKAREAALLEREKAVAEKATSLSTVKRGEPDFTQKKVYCKKSSGFSGKPVFFFVAGAEGTGHHLIIDLINKFPRIKTFPRKIQKLFWELWEPTITEDRNNRQRQQLYQELSNFSDQVAANLTSGDWNVIANTGTHFVIQEIGFDMYSYPFDDPRNVLRRPDLRDILAFANDFFEIRFIIMVRSELDSIVSLIKRGWWSPAFCDAGMKPPDNTNLFLVTPRGMCGYINVQVRVVEDALIYLNTQLLNLDENYFRVRKNPYICKKQQTGY